MTLPVSIKDNIKITTLDVAEARTSPRDDNTPHKQIVYRGCNALVIPPIMRPEKGNMF